MCYKQYSMGSCIIIFGTIFEQIYQLSFYPFLFFILSCFIYLYICLCFLCIVICMHSFHSAHIFIVCNSVMCTKSFNIWLWLYCFKLYSPYCVQFTELICYIHWILDFKYILLLLLLCFLWDSRLFLSHLLESPIPLQLSPPLHLPHHPYLIWWFVSIIF